MVRAIDHFRTFFDSFQDFDSLGTPSWGGGTLTLYLLDYWEVNWDMWWGSSVTDGHAIHHPTRPLPPLWLNANAGNHGGAAFWDNGMGGSGSRESPTKPADPPPLPQFLLLTAVVALSALNRRLTACALEQRLALYYIIPCALEDSTGRAHSQCRHSKMRLHQCARRCSCRTPCRMELRGAQVATEQQSLSVCVGSMCHGPFRHAALPCCDVFRWTCLGLSAG